MDELGDLIGATPDLWKIAIFDPLLAYKLVFGPNLPYVYRLQGPYPWAGARKAIIEIWKRAEIPTQTARTKRTQQRSSYNLFYCVPVVLVPAIVYMLFF